MAATLHDPRYERLIKLLAAARDESGLTQEAVGQRLKKPQSFLGKVETLQRRLDVLEFFDLLEAMEIEPGPFAERVAADVAKRGRSKRSTD